MNNLSSETENINLFSCKGILKRKNYFIFTVCVIIINFFIRIISRNIVNEDLYNFFLGIVFVLKLIIIPLSVFATIKRLRDIGWWLWLSIFSVMPISMLILSFIPSKSSKVEDKKSLLVKLKEFSIGSLYAVLYIFYLVLGLIQWAAIYAGVFSYTGNWILSFLIGGIVAYIPIIGTIAGIYGAYSYWEFPLWVSILLFTFHFILFGLFFIFQIILELIENRKKNV